jgi:hypothetical protein
MTQKDHQERSLADAGPDGDAWASRMKVDATRRKMGSIELAGVSAHAVSPQGFHLTIRYTIASTSTALFGTQNEACNVISCQLFFYHTV